MPPEMPAMRSTDAEVREPRLSMMAADNFVSASIFLSKVSHARLKLSTALLATADGGQIIVERARMIAGVPDVPAKVGMASWAATLRVAVMQGITGNPEPFGTAGVMLSGWVSHSFARVTIHRAHVSSRLQHSVWA